MKREKMLSNQETAGFCRSLALLLEAGVSLGDGLFLMAEDDSSDNLNILKKIGDKLDKGSRLYEAMADCGSFSLYAVGMVQTGERTGRLEEALFGLTTYYEDRCRINRQIRNALLYPAMILMIMIMVVGVLLIKVLPIFDQVYASLGGQLTGAAKWLLQLGLALKATLPVCGIFLVILLLGTCALAVREDLRSKILNVWNQYFGDKGICRKFNNARYAGALSLGMSSGMMLEEAAELAGSLMKNVPHAMLRCERCLNMIKKDSSLEEALAENGLLDRSSCRMLKVGMMGGTGDRVMEQIAKNMMEEAEESLEALVARVEPTMVLAASLMVGIILLTVMLPLVNIMASIG